MCVRGGGNWKKGMRNRMNGGKESSSVHLLTSGYVWYVFVRYELVIVTSYGDGFDDAPEGDSTVHST